MVAINSNNYLVYNKTEIIQINHHEGYNIPTNLYYN